MAKLFGDDELIAVYASAIHMDHNTHELIVDEKNGLAHIATEANRSPTDTAGEKNDEPVRIEQV
jgi:hypothetical protein